MQTLSIDIETYSDIDLTKSGVYAYTASLNFKILLFAYSFDEHPVTVIDLENGDTLPIKVLNALSDKNIMKTAFNAQFERTCLSRYLNIKLSPDSWSCTAVLAASLGLPLSLEGVAKVLGLAEQKMKEGKDLIRYFCLPCKPTQANGYRTVNKPSHAVDKWKRFTEYCMRDVEVEKAIRNKLLKYNVRTNEQRMYYLDQDINDRGILVDMPLVMNAIECDSLHKENSFTEAQTLTGLENPNSVAQLKQWLIDNGIEVDSLSKKAVSDLAKQTDGEVERLLNLRLKMAKTSVKKYEAIERAVCPDGRVRGLLQFYGANRTGRWAGRLVQVQNLPQNHLNDLTLARNLVIEGAYSTLDCLFESTPHVLSELIRTAFIPKHNHIFYVADFSAIEARVIAWLAREQWRIDVFATHGKIYEASASQMFKVPLEEITKGSPLRQKGKIAELALGYGGSVGALTAMGALEMGIVEDELKDLVNAWRQANPNITNLWWEVDKAAIKAVEEKTTVRLGRLIFHWESGILFIQLPSGRRLSYIKPKLETNKFGRLGLTYEGIGATKKWERIETYGPKLVENIVQAIARDLLAEAMLQVDENGYDIVMHVHDEIIVEVETGTKTLENLCELMSITPSWAAGLLLRADGYECEYYRKD